ncbi:unnamed protein product [Rhizoctonia solani]|uniref:Uncharacterized protein n=1 Tax=Rhizoctonia solani TaxID=456999 RepID=A0A8H3DL65_9AGAM|nr:unnamed protein product [Rhizoctonia solani]
MLVQTMATGRGYEAPRIQKLTNLLNRILNREQSPDTISEDPGLDFRRLSVSVSAPAQQILSGQDASTMAKDDERPPGLNNILTDSGDGTQLPQSPNHEEESASTPGNNFGAYTHGRRLAGRLRSASDADEAITVPALNAGVHHSQPQRYVRAQRPSVRSYRHFRTRTPTTTADADLPPKPLFFVGIIILVHWLYFRITDSLTWPTFQHCRHNNAKQEAKKG